jgi:hypothetical protein
VRGQVLVAGVEILLTWRPVLFADMVIRASQLQILVAEVKILAFGEEA